MIRVLVNGMGTIGKRVAMAVKKQDDMELVGISDAAFTGPVRTLLSPYGELHGTKLYCSSPKFYDSMKSQGIVEGLLEDLLKSGGVDVVVDASPKGIDAMNKEMYKKYGVKAIFQGGAEASIADVSFNSFTNYDEARGKQFVRVVSCNTTSLARTIGSLNKKYGVEKAFVTLIRRATDPPKVKLGPINAIVPDLRVPSHHGPDLKTVLHDVDAFTMAVKVPETLTHVHVVEATLKKEISRDELLSTFKGTPRINLIKASHGFGSNAELMEMMRDLGRPRYDMPEVAVWEELTHVEGNKVYWMHAVHSESIVIPENIDAIRAMFGMMDSESSIEKTDKALGIMKIDI